MNAFDRSTIPAAQLYLDDWAGRLTALRQLIQRLLPLIKTSQVMLANPAVNAIRMTKAMNTLPGLDSIALNDVIGDLNYCCDKIDLIQVRLRQARAVIR